MKIGASNHPLRRMRTIQVDNHRTLRLLATCDGGFATEAQLHVRFGAHHVRGEWFELSPAIESFAARLNESGGIDGVPREIVEGKAELALLDAEKFVAQRRQEIANAFDRALDQMEHTAAYMGRMQRADLADIVRMACGVLALHRDEIRDRMVGNPGWLPDVLDGCAG